MKKLLLAALCLLTLTGCSKALPVPELELWQATDIHYLSPQLTDYSADFIQQLYDSDGKISQHSPALAEALLSAAAEKKPAALLVSGDLTLNGGRESHQELAAVFRRIEEAGVPVLVVPGNHDAGGAAYDFRNGEAEAIWAIDPFEIPELYADFGWNEAIARDTDSQSYVYQLDPALRVLAIDSCTNVNASLSDKTLDWIEDQLKAAKKAGARVLPMSHHSLLQHHSSYKFGYVMNRAEQLEKLYKKYGVILHLSGHMHIQHITQGEHTADIATSALAVTPHQYGVIGTGPEGLAYSTAQLPLPEAIREEGVAMFDHSTRIRMESGIKTLGLPEAEAKAMLEAGQLFNRRYFGGSLAEDITALPAWKLWETHADSVHFGSYFQKILALDGATDMRSWSGTWK